MTITNITFKKTQSTATLSAVITMEQRKPETVFFSVPVQFADFIFADSSAFLAAMLIPALKRKEPVVIFGSVSARLFVNIEKIATLLKEWRWISDYPKRAVTEKFPDMNHPKQVAAFFSGGVDSFYTLLTHKKELTHLILVKGFDIETANDQLFKQTVKNCEEIAKKTGVTIIPVTTNCKQIIEQFADWDYAHGGALAGVALFLRNGFKKIYIAGSLPKEALFPYGTHPDLDPLWGTEQLQIVHDGTAYSRQEKISKKLVRSPLVQQYLRVCAQNNKDEYNCSRCLKCTRTMIEFAIAGGLENMKTFRHDFDTKRIEQLVFDPQVGYAMEARRYITSLRRLRKYPEVVTALQTALQHTYHPSVLKRTLFAVARIDKTYNNRRLYYAVFGLTKNHDRNRLFKFLAAKGMIK